MNSNVVLDHDTMVENILTVWASASDEDRQEGAAWYPAAHTFARGLGVKYGLTTFSACGIVAALSPRVSWDVNLRLAETLCSTGDVRCLGVSRRRALAIWHGAAPEQALVAPPGNPRSGRKVRAFYANIAHPYDATGAVTIDRHAWDIAAGCIGTDESRKGLDRVGVYDALEDAYHSAAVALRGWNVLATTVQATTWVTWRRTKGTK